MNLCPGLFLSLKRGHVTTTGNEIIDQRRRLGITRGLVARGHSTAVGGRVEIVPIDAVTVVNTLPGAVAIIVVASGDVARLVAEVITLPVRRAIRVALRDVRAVAP